VRGQSSPRFITRVTRLHAISMLLSPVRYRRGRTRDEAGKSSGGSVASRCIIIARARAPLTVLIPVTHIFNQERGS